MDEVAGAARARLTVEPGTGDGGPLRVRLGGELDIEGVPQVQPELDALLAREPQPVLLDLAELEFLDSSGVAVLVRIANHFAPVELRNAVPAVRRVIEVLGLSGSLGLSGAPGLDGG